MSHRMIYPRLWPEPSEAISPHAQVNDTPITRDVFFSRATQQGMGSLLVGGLRLLGAWYVRRGWPNTGMER